MATVKDFFETFEFERMLTDAPKPIQDFLDGEIKFIKDFVEPGKKVLEIGGGYGRLLEILSDFSEHVVGIDFSKSLLLKATERLKTKKNVDVKFMYAEKMSFEDDSFDYVLCLDATFGNMPGIELEALKEMKRVCKPGGKIVISVFSEKAEHAQFENYTRIGLTNIQDNGKAIHTEEGFYSRRFTKNDLKEFFEKVDLKCDVTSICSINHIAYAVKE